MQNLNAMIFTKNGHCCFRHLKYSMHNLSGPKSVVLDVYVHDAGLLFEFLF